MSETLQELRDNQNEEEDDEDDESYEEQDEDDDDEEDEDDYEDEDDDDTSIEVEVEDLSAPLFAAIVTGDFTVVKSFACINLSARTNLGSYPLIIEAKYGHLDIVRYFMYEGEIMHIIPSTDVHTARSLQSLLSLDDIILCLIL